MRIILSLALLGLIQMQLGCASHNDPGTDRQPAQYGGGYSGTAAIVGAKEVPVNSNVPWAVDEMKMKGGDLTEAKAFHRNNENRMSQLWHIGEGSEVYPLAWMIRLRSKTQNQCGHRNKGVGERSYFIEKMDEKFGATWDPIPSKFPVRFIGVTAVWSSMHPEGTDDSHVARTEVDIGRKIGSRLDYNREIERRRSQGSDWDEIKVLSGDEAPIFETGNLSDAEQKALGFDKEKNSIAMSGVNCTFCHSGSIQNGDHEYILDGIPNVVSSGDFFGDMTVSTVATMLDAQELTEFLQSFPKVINRAGGDYKKVENYAKDFTARFTKDLNGKSPGFFERTLAPVIKHLNSCNWILGKLVLDKKKTELKKHLYENRDVTKKYLLELVDYTFGFGGVSNISPTIVSRMEWLAYVLGLNQKIDHTLQGYGRTDAFGRVGNWLLPYHKQADINAPASSPYMWGMKYRPMFNYPGNTNSVTVRNLLQSIGLGATMPWYNRDATAEDIGDAIGINGAPPKKPWALYVTTNLHTMNRIERLLYGIRIPNFYGVFKNTTSNGKVVSESTSLRPYEYTTQALDPNATKKYTFYFEEDAPKVVLAESEITKAVKGCNTYVKTCYQCHDSAGARVLSDFNSPRVGYGPVKRLIAEGILSKTDVGTDPYHANNLARTVPSGVLPSGHTTGPGGKDLFWATGQTVAHVLWPVFTHVETGYYRRWMGVTDPDKDSTVIDWRNAEFRGQQVIRDGTLNKNFPDRIQPVNHGLDYVTLKEDRHYVARNLAGIWATAPYLHNASVPTIMQLLTPANQRIKKFYVMSKQYNMDELGYNYLLHQQPHYQDLTNIVESDEKEFCRTYPYACFDTSQRGNSNMGHSGPLYGTNLSLAEKQNLIAFLKVLQPEPEFAWQMQPVYKIDYNSMTCSPNL